MDSCVLSLCRACVARLLHQHKIYYVLPLQCTHSALPTQFGLAREDHVYIKTTDGKLPLRWSHMSVCVNAYVCTSVCGVCIHVCIIMYVLAGAPASGGLTCYGASYARQ